MASHDFDATTTPQNVASVLGLTDGTTYEGQNVSTPGATLFMRSAASAPSADDRAFRVESGGVFLIKPEGDPLWLWTDDASGCRVIINEAA